MKSLINEVFISDLATFIVFRSMFAETSYNIFPVFVQAF